MEGALVMEDAMVVALVRAGNAAAFAELVERYQVPVQRYLYRLTGDFQLAEDLVQDTFLLAYKGIFQTDSQLSFRAWLYRIATNNAFGFYRRKKRLSFIPFSGLNKAVEPAACAQNPDEAIAIQEALLKVPQEQRSCLALHLIEGFRYREIAATLGISEDAVRMRVDRGKESFRRIYRGG